MAVYERWRVLETLRWIPVFTSCFNSYFTSRELNWAAVDHAARIFHARRLMGNSSLWNTYVCVSAKVRNGTQLLECTWRQGLKLHSTALNGFSLFVSLHHQSPQAQRVRMDKLMPETIGSLCIENVLLGPFLPLVRSAVVSFRHQLSDTVWLYMESGMNASPLEVFFTLGHNLYFSKGPHLMPFLHCNKTAQHKTKQNNEQKLGQPPVEMTKENKTRGQTLSYQWSPGFFSRSFLLMAMWETDSSLKMFTAAAVRGSTDTQHPENLALHPW